MSIEQLIQNYGYFAVLVGTFFEGETVLVLGGFAAYREYLHLPWVVLVAFVGSFMGDQLWFYIGRHHSDRVLRRMPAWRRRIDRLHQAMERYQDWVILGFRFVYGFRTVTPFVLGMGGVSLVRFVILNAIGAGIWAAAVGGAGFLFGGALEIVLADIRRYERWAMVLIAVTGLALWLRHRIRRRRGREP